ncbi:hypothetical protein BLNAU_6787 [Blattamonas nauphoetae]|uniref:Uncharacterized protein n=1 Tax=Blattamonas nauphoetae TaxID=2049346 RepID=A0ABQ9Y3G9_9EUKA|nr:hypothetical protein BLNAU_6787 [Blattamonas nauphoetae]
MGICLSKQEPEAPILSDSSFPNPKFDQLKSSDERTFDTVLTVMNNLVMALHNNVPLDIERQQRVLSFLDSITPWGRSQLRIDLIFNSVPLLDSYMTLVSSNYSMISVHTLQYLATLAPISKNGLWSLINAGMVDKLMKFLHSGSLHLIDDVILHTNLIKIVKECICLVLQSYNSWHNVQSQILPTDEYATLFSKVLEPSHNFILFLLESSKFRSTDDDSYYVLKLQLFLLQIAPRSSDLENFVISLPITSRFPSSLVQFGDPTVIRYLPEELSTTLENWAKPKKDLSNHLRRILSDLCSEGILDELELMFLRSRRKGFQRFGWNNEEDFIEH